MTENAKKFLELISSDETLAARVADKPKEELVEVANEHGIPLCIKDFDPPAQALSDDELDTVVGGGSCYCALGGGGTKDSQNKTCACVVYGQGDTKSGKMRCMCPAAGGGADGEDVSHLKCMSCSCGCGL